MPFSDINAYNIHDVSEWRDLNLKFVLQVWRDHRLLRAHCPPFADDRCRTMPYIDDVRDDDADDLYARATGQAPPPPTPHAPAPDLAPAPAQPRPRDILSLLYSGELPAEAGGEARPAPGAEGSGVWSARLYLAHMYPACAALLRKARAWDTDGDGLIENGGFPDQTYDAWVMKGPR